MAKVKRKKSKGIKGIPKAGIVLTRIEKGEKQILVVEHFGGRYFSYPKGHIEKGEKAEDCARREVFEETGYSVKIIKPLPDLFYVTEAQGKIFQKMFLSEIVTFDESHKPEEKFFLVNFTEAQRRFNDTDENHSLYWQRIREIL